MKPNSNIQNITENELRLVLAEIFKRAQVSNEFRELCLEDAGQAVFEISGKTLPVGAKLSFTSL